MVSKILIDTNVLLDYLLEREPFFEDAFDFEDCLQMECAKSYGAEYIVTRNVLDYSVSDIKTILPSEYLEL